MPVSLLEARFLSGGLVLGRSSVSSVWSGLEALLMFVLLMSSCIVILLLHL